MPQAFYVYRQGAMLSALALLICLSACDPEPQTSSDPQDGMGGNTVTTRETVTSELLGKVRRSEFERMNSEGIQAIAELQAIATKLTPTDQALLREVAELGQRQYALSQAAQGQLEHAHAASLAQAEQAEQAAFKAKLQELGKAYQLSLPSAQPTELQAQIAEFKSLKGRERDLFYLGEAGVAGHQSLEDLMTRVESQAKDASLKQLATLSLPLIRAHLQVSEDVGNELRATALGGT